jgi:SAM-dependent methyltransferase
MASNRFTDRTVLTTEAYADPAPLTARYALYRHRQPPLDLPGVVTELLHDVPGPVLDVGCGPGRTVAALRADRPQRTVVAVDLSPGMLAVTGAPAMVADITALPVATGSAGAVLAMHMLYHVPDPEAGIREMARAKAPGGTVVISTNGDDDKEGLYDVCRAATADIPGAAGWSRQVSRRFALGAAEELAGRYFASVRRIELTGDIVVPDPEPVVAFIRSLGAWVSQPLFGTVVERIRERVADLIARDGEFRFGTRIGILVCQ